MFPFDPPENILSSGESKGIIGKNMVNILYTPYNFQGGGGGGGHRKQEIRINNRSNPGINE